MTVLVLALGAGVSDATYTGAAETTTLGTPAAGGGLIAIPLLDSSSDPGDIDGNPYNRTDTSLTVSPLSGPRKIAFRTDATPVDSLGFPAHPGIELSNATDAAVLASTSSAVFAAWPQSGGIVGATLARSGAPTDLVHFAGTPDQGTLALVTGPDGAYAAQWSQGSAGYAAVVAPGQTTAAPLLGADATFPAADQLVLAGGEDAWLVAATHDGTSAAPVTVGQDTAPVPVAITANAYIAAAATGAGALLVLTIGPSGWELAHLDRAGNVSAAPLPAGATDPLLAVRGGTAYVAFGLRCRVHLDKVGTLPARLPAGQTLGGGCATPKRIAVDPASGAAYVLSSAGRNAVLEVARGAHVQGWRGSLGGTADALVAAGSGRVLLESTATPHDVGEQCGGAADSYNTRVTERVFDGAHVQRTGTLYEAQYNC
jgi:hypothetical protein